MILAASFVTLAFAARRIVAENAGYSGAAAPRCVPTQLNRSDVLAGTPLQVSPLPGSLDASYKTQISFVGAPASALSDISVRGSSSGAHAGRLQAYSQGDGASFVPSRPFRAGETVTVHGKVTVAGRTRPFAFRFTTAVPNPIGHPASAPKPAGEPGELLEPRSRPDLHVPRVTVSTNLAGQAPGDIFVAPYIGAGQNGPMIFESSGNLVWFHPLPSGTEAINLQVQSYEGKPVLTWWQGYIPPQGFGEGEEVIANSSYQQIMKFPAGNGLPADLHEFHINQNGTALLTSFDPIRCNLSSVGGPSNGAVTDSVFQEIDLKTHLVRREWAPLDHIPLASSYSSPVKATGEWPFDYFHLNSVDPQPGGSILISSRNTSALYELNATSGQVTEQIGGKHSSVKLGAGASTAYQHDAQVLPGGEISVFDNGGVPKVHPQSRGLVLAINQRTKTDTVVAQYEHPTALSSGSQGNIQMLPNGDVFVGWGAEPYFSEFSASGQLLFDGHMHGSYESYRAYRFPWTGTPKSTPAIAATAAKGGAHATVYASWNGATEVASWRVLAGPSAAKLAPVATTADTGFETAIVTPGPAPYVAAQALSASGAVLSTSRTIKG